LAGDGSLVLSGANANTFTGTTTVDAGTLILNKSAGNAIIGDVAIGDGAGTDTLQLSGSNQIADTAAIALASSGIFDVNGQSEIIGSLTSAASSAQVQLRQRRTRGRQYERQYLRRQHQRDGNANQNRRRSAHVVRQQRFILRQHFNRGGQSGLAVG